MGTVHPPEILDYLSGVDSPTISNAIETFEVRDRSEGFMGPKMQCRFPEMGAMCGYAVTVTVDTIDRSNPPKTDAYTNFRQFQAMTDSPKPSIVVVQDLSKRHGWSAHWGEIMGSFAKALGALGTDGAVRDLDALKAIGFNTWSTHVCVSHGDLHVVDVGIPLEICGLHVEQGDLLHCDLNGVVSIPHDLVPKMSETVHTILQNEQNIFAWVRHPDFTVETFKEKMGVS